MNFSGPALAWAIEHREELNCRGAAATTTLTITSAANGIPKVFFEKKIIEQPFNLTSFLNIIMYIFFRQTNRCTKIFIRNETPQIKIHRIIKKRTE